MDVMSSGDESDAEYMSTDMLEDICGVSQSHPSVNRREERYKIIFSLKEVKRNKKENYYLRKT